MLLQVALIPLIHPGTIELWLPVGDAFERLLRPLARYALRAIVWSHGAEELSAPAGGGFNSTAYADALAAVVEGTRVAWGQGDIAWISAQTSAVAANARSLAELRVAQTTIAPRPGGGTALSGVVCTHDLGDLSSASPQPSRAGSDRALGARLAAQVLHVQWGFSDAMSTSPAAVAAGLQSLDWRSYETCKNGSSEMPIESAEAAPVVEDEAPSVQQIAAVPPMGWASWNAYHCNVDETIVLKTARMLVKTGLARLGYRYVVPQDCMFSGRAGENRTLVEDPARWPSSLKGLSAMIHGMGLLFGSYTSATEFTCQWRQGSYAFEAEDARNFCEQGLDYLWIDACNGAKWPAVRTSWELLRKGNDECVAKGGRPMVMHLSSCNPQLNATADPPEFEGCMQWIGSVGNLWRTTGDIQGTFASILQNLDGNNEMASIAKPGNYNDPDMLQVGNPGFSFNESLAHFMAWSVVAAPLMISADIHHAISNESLSILSAEEIIRIDQDPMGQQGVRVSPPNATGAECWARNLSDGGVAAMLLARFPPDVAGEVHCTWGQLWRGARERLSVRDTWRREDLGVHSGGRISAVLAGHSAMLLRLRTDDETTANADTVPASPTLVRGDQGPFACYAWPRTLADGRNFCPSPTVDCGYLSAACDSLIGKYHVRLMDADGSEVSSTTMIRSICSGSCEGKYSIAPDSGHSPPIDRSRLLTETGFIMTHDSATGYLDGNGNSDAWMKTQTAAHCAHGAQSPGTDCSFSFADQLDCGARAFDLRPTVQPGGVLMMHHDFLVPDTLLSTAVADVLAWAAANAAELVLLYVSHCDHDDVEGGPGGSHRQAGAGACAETFEYLRAQGIHLVLAKSELEAMTLGEAMDAAELKGGGRVLGIGPGTMCCGENWSPDISCYPGDTSCCYDTLGCSGVESTVQTMWDYAAGLTAPRTPVPHDGLWMVQGHWQYDHEAWAKGQAHSSSICLDEDRSGVNAGIADKISSGAWQRVNIVEVDNVCDGGRAMLDAVRQYNAPKSGH